MLLDGENLTECLHRLPSISSRAGIASDGASFSVSATSSDLATRVTSALTVYNPSPHSSPIPSFQFGVQCPSGVAEPLLPPTLLLFVCAVLVAVSALTGLSSLTFIIFNALPDSDRSKMPELVVDPEGFPLDVELKASISVVRIIYLTRSLTPPSAS